MTAGFTDVSLYRLLSRAEPWPTVTRIRELPLAVRERAGAMVTADAEGVVRVCDDSDWWWRRPGESGGRGDVGKGEGEM